MKSQTSQEAKFTELTQNVFFVHYENSFVVLPDAKTIVGINKIDESTLIMENIKTKKAINFGIREGYLCTLLYDKVTGSLLTGDDWGIIFHYKRGGNQGNFCLVKKYENLGIKSVKSTAQMGGLAILGDFGEWDSSLILIDIHKREVCQKKKKILYFPNFSLHVFRGQNQEMYLSLGANFFFMTISRSGTFSTRPRFTRSGKSRRSKVLQKSTECSLSPTVRMLWSSLVCLKPHSLTRIGP